MISYAIIIIERAEDGGYGAWCPDLPRCVAFGGTETDAHLGGPGLASLLPQPDFMPQPHP